MRVGKQDAPATQEGRSRSKTVYTHRNLQGTGDHHPVLLRKPPRVDALELGFGRKEAQMDRVPALLLWWFHVIYHDPMGQEVTVGMKLHHQLWRGS